jgi:hypothetical protein
MAIARVLDASLAHAGCAARVAAVTEDRRLGLVAEIAPGPAGREEQVAAVLDRFTVPWRWREPS